MDIRRKTMRDGTELIAVTQHGRFATVAAALAFPLLFIPALAAAFIARSAFLWILLALPVLALVPPAAFPRFVLTEQGVTNWRYGCWRERWGWDEVQACRVVKGPDLYAAQIEVGGRWHRLAVLESHIDDAVRAVQLIHRTGGIPREEMGEANFVSLFHGSD